jgi:DNA excision repair protein ERCC-2
LDGLEVLFPYTYIYPEQYKYMYRLKKALDAGVWRSNILDAVTPTAGFVLLLMVVVVTPQYREHVYWRCHQERARP